MSDTPARLTAAYGLLPDGEAFLFIQSPQGSQAEIVINWVEELRQRLGR